jgi:hypothetical protein
MKKKKKIDVLGSAEPLLPLPIELKQSNNQLSKAKKELTNLVFSLLH